MRRDRELSPPRDGAGRRRAFLAATIAAPWLLLALLELGLRLAGVGGAYPLFVPHAARPEYLTPNPEAARRYFRGAAFTPNPELDLFRARKAANAFRIVVQGESSAQGFPYGHGGAPSRMLEQRLEATFPNREIEVVNVALTGITSYALLDQADEIVDQRPDAVLIYTGHNEYYGALGAASARRVAGRPALVRAYLALSRLRLVQLLEGLLGRAAAGRPGAAEPPRTVMELLAGDQRVPLGSPLYERGLEQLRANLRALLARYREAGVPVLIGTIASNERDQPPLDAALAKGAGGDESRGADSAAALYAEAREREARGDTAGARERYRAAKERDQLRFRAPEAMNAIIREEAARAGATVVETQQALERASPGGIVGRTLMLEHLHPNLDGYFLIADRFYEAMRARGMIGGWERAVPAERARREIPVTAIDSLVAVFRTDRLLSGWPFRPRGASRTSMVDTLRPRTTAEELARAVVLGQLPWPEATERLRVAAERAGDDEQAIRAARALAQEYSYAPEPYLDAARLAIRRRRWDDALAFARAAVARRETAAEVQLVGLLLLRLGDHPGAMPHLERAAALAPGDREIAAAARAARALPELERRRDASPRDAAALHDLAVAYALTQQFERSRAVLATLLAVAPGHAGARALLEQLPPAEG